MRQFHLHLYLYIWINIATTSSTPPTSFPGFFRGRFAAVIFSRWFRRVTAATCTQRLEGESSRNGGTETEGSSPHTAARTARTALSGLSSHVPLVLKNMKPHDSSLSCSLSLEDKCGCIKLSSLLQETVLLCAGWHIYPQRWLPLFSYCFQDGSDNGSHFGALCSPPCGIQMRRLLITAARSLEFHSSLSCLFQLHTVQWGNARKCVVVPLVIDGTFLGQQVSALHISALLYLRSLFYWWVEMSDWISHQELRHKRMLKLIGHVIHKCCKSAV